jgi:hypothetical protein
MNRNQAIRELTELADHLQRVLHDIESGRYDENGDLAYQVGLQHLMDHLARAWHFARMTDEKIDALTQEQFAQLTNAIPKLGVDQRFVESWEDVI